MPEGSEADLHTEGMQKVRRYTQGSQNDVRHGRTSKVGLSGMTAKRTALGAAVEYAHDTVSLEKDHDPEKIH